MIQESIGREFLASLQHLKFSKMSIFTWKSAANVITCNTHAIKATFLHSVNVPNKYTSNGPSDVEYPLDATKTPRIDGSLSYNRKIHPIRLSYSNAPIDYCLFTLFLQYKPRTEIS